MKKLFFFSIVTAVAGVMMPIASASSNLAKEVSCSQFGLPVNDNNQCFEWSYKMYFDANQKHAFSDYIVNKGDTPLFIFQRDPSGEVGFTATPQWLQGTTFRMSESFGFNWVESWNKKFHIKNPRTQEIYQGLQVDGNSTIKALQSQGYISWTEKPQNLDSSKPVFQIHYETKTYGSVNKNGKYSPNPKDVKYHNEYAFYYGLWCGDGVVSPEYGEKYDDGANNGKPGFASTDCKQKNPPAPIPEAGVCDGASSGIATYKVPTGKLCAHGVQSAVIEQNGKFVWSCGGVNGGTTASCEAPKKQDAVCGSSDGKIVSTTPNTNLCLVGTATPVTGNNPYSWTCQGVNGGNNVTCGTTPPKKDEPSKNVCDQTFNGTLRVGTKYMLSDYYHNDGNVEHILRDFSVNLKESHDMNKDGKLTYNNYVWANGIYSGYKVPGKTRDLKILTLSSPYHVMVAPEKRQKDNIRIEYTLQTSDTRGDHTHKECIDYEVTWCGDGIVDTDEGEKCDPNDPKKTNWGKNGCNNSCQPQEEPQQDLEIKKYVKNIDNVGDSQSAPVTVALGETFNYYYVFENKNPTNISNVFLKDTFPAYLTFDGKVVIRDKNGNDVTSDFTIKQGKITVNNQEHITLAIIKKTPLVGNSGKYTVTVPTKIATTAPNNVNLQNMVYICGDNTTGKPTDPSGKNVCEKNPNTCEPNDPSCMPTPPPQQCTPENNPYNDPACITVENPGLTIKKLAGNKDGQTSSDALMVDFGQDFTYTYQVKATGNTDQNRATVTDLFPLGVTVTGFKTVPTGWTCNFGVKNVNGKNHSTVVCQTPKMAKNTSVDIVVNAKLATNLSTLGVDEKVFNLGLRNIAYVCSDEVKNPGPNNTHNVCKPDCTDPNTSTCTPPTPPVECSPIPGNPHYDPACVVPGKKELEIKKYVKTIDNVGDSQGAPVTVAAGETFNYYYVFENNEDRNIENVTLKDSFPLYLTFNGNVSVKDANGADVTSDFEIKTGKIAQSDGEHITLYMKKKTSLKARSGKYTVTVPVTLANTVEKNVNLQNMVYICGDNTPSTAKDPSGNNVCETKKCDDPNNPSCMPTPPPKGSCTPEDNTKQDPACIRVPNNPNPTPGSPNYAAAVCSNNVVVVKTYSNKTECQNEVQNSFPNSAPAFSCEMVDGNLYQRLETEKERLIKANACQPKTPNTPTGPGGGGGGGGSPYCGDGIVNHTVEQCDLGSRNGSGATCSNSCTLQVSPTTNPGANPIEFKISIPGFVNVLGYSTTIGNKTVDSNGIVVGVGSPLFTRADAIDLAFNPKYRAPVQLEADREFTLASTNGGVVEGTSKKSTALQTLAGNNYPYWELNGKRYYVLGEGDLLIPKDANIFRLACPQTGTQFKVCAPQTTTSSSLTLFRGYELTDFKGKAIGDAKMTLGTVYNAVSNDLAQFPVSVVSSKVTANRVLRNLRVNFRQTTTGFLDYYRNNTQNNTQNTSIQNNTTQKINITIPVANTFTNDVTISSLSDLEKYKLNGNANVYAVKGNVILDFASSNNTLEMSGVKTILVEGNLTIKSNTQYKDANASWAFITKGGNIKIDTKVTNLSGVFMSIKEGTNGGNIESLNGATANILRIDGTMYGDAKNLFDSRTYARGSNSHEILTTGTVLTYSSRALRNPPPLLSQFLNTYQVQRVVR